MALLAGVRVLDLTTSIAGPYAAMLLGDFGADVVKVESIDGGDDARAWGPPFLEGESLWFLSVNRNKRGVALDLASEAGLQALHDLIDVADVLIINRPAAVAARLGIDYGAASARNPRLVYASITGFGLDGERADHACYDLIAEGHSGVMDLTGAKDGAPQKVGVPAADMLAGQDAALAALAALLARHKSGAGSLIDISLLESMTRFLTCRVVPYLGSGEMPTRSGGTDSVIAIYRTFETADRPITLGLGNNSIWRRFCEAINRTDLVVDTRFQTNADRRAHREWLVEQIAEVIRHRPQAHWLAAFRTARVPAGPINTVADVSADLPLRERGLFFAIAEEERVIPQVGLGIHFDGEPAAPRFAPPALGAHSREVLGDWLNYDQSALDALFSKPPTG
nr:CoA transferase [Chelatococcus asaccharovorans]